MAGPLSVLPFPTFGTDITVGNHVQRVINGHTFNVDIIWSTLAAMALTFVLAMMLRRQITSGVPGRLQSAWEAGLQAIQNQIAGSIGPRGLAIVPLALTLFVFILICNMFEAVGLGSPFEWLTAPTSDINLPLAMALFVIVLVHIASIRSRGIVGYLKHYAAQPFPVFLCPINLFLNIVEEIAKPLTLALRLFGNLLSGGLMLSLIAALGAWKLGAIPVGNVFVFLLNPIWKLFDLGIGTIQAFIFALLTILYFDVAMSTDHDEGDAAKPGAGIDPLGSIEVAEDHPTRAGLAAAAPVRAAELG